MDSTSMCHLNAAYVCLGPRHKYAQPSTSLSHPYSSTLSLDCRLPARCTIERCMSYTPLRLDEGEESSYEHARVAATDESSYEHGGEPPAKPAPSTVTLARVVLLLLAAVLLLSAAVAFSQWRDARDEAAAAAACPASHRILFAISVDPKDVATLGLANLKTWVASMGRCHEARFFVGRQRQQPTDAEHARDDESGGGEQKAELDELGGEAKDVETVGVSSVAAATDVVPLVELECYDGYPPVDKELYLWRYVYRNFVGEFQWFVKVDADAYVNVARLEESLLHDNHDGRKGMYVGAPGRGRPEQQGTLDLHAPFCQGLGYGIHADLLQRMGPHMDECIAERLPAEVAHSDTEMGRCLWRHGDKTRCKAASREFIPVFYGKENGVVVPRSLRQNQQMELPFPRDPPSRYFDSPIVHPIKSAASYYLFHKQAYHNLRPVYQAIHSIYAAPGSNMSQKAVQHNWKVAVKEQNSSCTNNPELQRAMYAIQLNECEPPVTSFDERGLNINHVMKELAVLVVTPIPAHTRHHTRIQLHAVTTAAVQDESESESDSTSALVSESGGVGDRSVAAEEATLLSSSSDEYYGALAAAFHSLNVSVDYHFLSLPESSVVRGAVAYAASRHLPRVLILRDDVEHVPARLTRILATAFNESRCGGSLGTAHEGGMLLLSLSSKKGSSLSSVCYNLADVDGSVDTSALLVHSAMYHDLRVQQKEDMRTLLRLSVAGYAIRATTKPVFIKRSTRSPDGVH